METLRVYGTKNGTEKMIFSTLANTASCIATAKKNAALHGYEITKVIKVGTSATMFQEENITAEFLKA